MALVRPFIAAAGFDAPAQLDLARDALAPSHEFGLDVGLRRRPGEGISVAGDPVAAVDARWSSHARWIPTPATPDEARPARGRTGAGGSGGYQRAGGAVRGVAALSLADALIRPRTKTMAPRMMSFVPAFDVSSSQNAEMKIHAPMSMFSQLIHDARCAPDARASARTATIAPNTMSFHYGSPSL